MPASERWSPIALATAVTVLILLSGPGLPTGHSHPSGPSDGLSAYRDARVPGSYAPAPSAGAGAPAFLVAFTASGLPPGLNWSVTVNGTTTSSNTTVADAELPNGTYTYTVSSPSGWIPTVSSGSVTVDGEPTTVVARILGYNQAEGVLSDSSNDRLYIPNATGNSLRILNLSDWSLVKLLRIGSYGLPPLLGTNGKFVYEINNNDGNVSVINASSDSLATTLAVGQAPWPGAVDPNTGYLYVPNSGSSNVSVIDTANHTIVRSLTTDTQPLAVATVPDRNELYVATGGTIPYVDVLNLSSHSIAGRIRINTGLPLGLAYAPVAHAVFMTDTQHWNLLKIDVTNRTIVQTIPLRGGGPWEPLFDPLNGLVYVPKTGFGSNVSLVDPTTGLVVETIALGGTVSVASLDPVSGEIYVPEYGGLAIDIIDGRPTTVSVDFSRAPTRYSVQFAEGNLPAGLSWSVALGDQTNSSTSPTIGFVAPNGTYPYRIGYVGGYRTVPEVASVTISGSDVTVPVPFAVTTYPVQFDEIGLPSGSSWSVDLNGSIASSIGTSLIENDPNGSYSFQVNPPVGFIGNVSSGVIAVRNGSVDVSVAFRQANLAYSVTFSESTLPTGSNWTVDLMVAGVETVRSTTLTTLTFLEPNGSYTYGVESPAAWIASVNRTGTIVVAGESVGVVVTFAPLVPQTYALSFVESGLPAATSWAVTIDGVTHRSDPGRSDGVLVMEANGTYPWVVSSPAGYSASPSSATAVVAGSNLTEHVTFTLEGTGTGVGAPGSGGLSGTTLLLIAAGAVGAAVAVGAIVIVYLRRRPDR